MLEPRGHAGMYGVIPTPACNPDADFAVLFTHQEGYSTMCGHATIALGRWAVDTGRVASHHGA
jgi:trans-L-3-hydroxyproline dehydratase